MTGVMQYVRDKAANAYEEGNQKMNTTSYHVIVVKENTAKL